MGTPGRHVFFKFGPKDPGHFARWVADYIAHHYDRASTRRRAEIAWANLAAYLAAQRQRLAAGELDAAKLTGEAGPHAAERAAWMLVARAAMNLDEAIVKR